MAFGGLRGTLQGSATSITNPTNATGSVAVQAGDLILAVCFEQTGRTASGVTDNLTNSYSAVSAGSTHSAVSARAFYARAGANGTLTQVSFAATASANNVVVLAAVIEGPFQVAPLDKAPTDITADVSTPYTCPSTTTLSQAREVVCCWFVTNASVTHTATSPNLKSHQLNTATILTGSIGYQAVAATTAVAPAWTSSATPTSDVLGTASFKAADATGTGTPTAQAADLDAAGISASTGSGMLAGTEGEGPTLDLDFAADTITEGAIDPTGFATLAGVGEAAFVSTGTGALVAGDGVVAGDGEVVTPPAIGTGDLESQAAIAVSAGLSGSTGIGVLPAAAGPTLDLNFAADTITEAAAAYAATIVGVGTVAAPEATGIGVLTSQVSTLAGAGLSSSTGTAALAAGAATVAAAGLSVSSGTGNLTVQAAIVAGAGLSASTGTGILAATAAILSGTGTVASTGTGILAAGVAQVAGAGLSVSTGTAALAAQAATLAATGISSSTGTGALASGTAALVGAGLSTSAGTGALAAGSAVLAGIGLSASTGTGVLADQASVLAGAGLSASSGVGALTAGSATIFGAEGIVPITGTGALAAEVAQIAGAGLSASVGIGTLAAEGATISGAGIAASAGSGNLVADVATIVGEGAASTLVYLRPDGDTTLDGWTDQVGGIVDIVQSIDEVSANDNDYVQSPAAVGTQADLKVRLFDGTTQIAEWVHLDVGDEFADAVQTLTTPQVEAIGDFSSLFVELDDNTGNVYRFSLGDPPAQVAEPVRLRYRYKKLAA